MKVQVRPTNPIAKLIEEDSSGIQVGVQETGPQGKQGDKGEKGEPGTPGLSLISAATDVDVTNIGNGALLIFNEDTNKWTAGTMLEDQYIEGGHF